MATTKPLGVIFTRVAALFLLTLALATATGRESQASAARPAFTVSTTDDTADADPGDGLCATDQGDCTLRAAVIEANALGGEDSIILPAGTYTLTIAGADENVAFTGDLDVKGRLILSGAGADAAIIDGNGAVTGDRVFHIQAGASVSMSGVTIRGGTADNGGGIYNAGQLSLGNSALSENSATGTFFAGGGAIYNSGLLILKSSTLSNNTAADRGGGLYNTPDTARSNVGNSTLSGNSAGHGGGIFNDYGIVTHANVTLVSNYATYEGGGLYHLAGVAALRHTILADNTSGWNSPECWGALTSKDYNVVEDVSGGCIVNAKPNDLIGVDPLVGPLQDNGGRTQTHALLTGSPAIDAGDPAGCVDHRGKPITEDQRGQIRPADGNGDGQSICDIGAYEAVGADFALKATPASQGVCAPASADFTLVVSAIGGFASPVTLSATGVPDGATADFAPNPVIPSGSSTMTISNTAAATPGIYTIEVTGSADPGSGYPAIVHDVSAQLRLFDSVPGQPLLIAPADGAMGQSLRPTFTWTAGQGDTYGIQVATDSGFNNVVAAVSGLIIPAFTPAATLDASTTYYWRVRAANACGESDDSSTFSFTTWAEWGGLLTVNSTGDGGDAYPGDGLCATSDDLCTLRAAVQEGNALPAGEDVTIVLPAGNYRLTLAGRGEDNAATGDLDINHNMALTGDGANLTTIDGEFVQDRVFHISDTAVVTVAGVTIRGGREEDGGGIYNSGVLTLTASTVTGNSALRLTSADGGGGIFNRGTLVVQDSTIAANTSVNRGGGISNRYSTGKLTLINSTISGNTADYGGGIFHELGLLTLANGTVSTNIAGKEGGGIYVVSGQVVTRNSLWADNTAADAGPDCWGVLRSRGYNLMVSMSDCNFATRPGDQIGVKPLLGPLLDNGGPTWTHALLAGSPAIDAGNPAGCTDHDGNLLTTDQRGFIRPVDGDGNGSAICDIGAYEQQ